MHCSSVNNNDPCMAGCRNCCYGWGILDCFPASMEACGALLVIFVIIFAILGIAYGLLAATMAIQRIWQRHYHILTKRELTKVINFDFIIWAKSYILDIYIISCSLLAFFPLHFPSLLNFHLLWFVGIYCRRLAWTLYTS